MSDRQLDAKSTITCRPPQRCHPQTRYVRWSLVGLMALSLNGCLGTVVGSAVDVTLEVAKVPFKVAGAVADVVTDDEDD